MFPEIEVLFVDDGCPNSQTFITLLAFSSRWRNVHYIRQKNLGLSSARNAGIDFFLRPKSKSKAIYFLDADNYLSTYSIDNMISALEENPEADWFYPDIRMVGLKRFNDYSGKFNKYVEASVNVCEAGSLIRRRVFENGHKFNENMRQGYEDWDFWLSAMESGFKGMHLPGMGLCYRKRAESMLADSTRIDSQIRADIRRRHQDTYQINSFVYQEHLNLPRFAVVVSDRSIARLCSDLVYDGQIINLADFESLIVRSFREPQFLSAGEFLIVSTSSILGRLQSAGLIRSISIEIELALRHAQCVGLNLSVDDGDRIGFSSQSGKLTSHDLVALPLNYLSKAFGNDDEHYNFEEALHKSFCDAAVINVVLPEKYALRGACAPLATDYLIAIGNRIWSEKCRDRSKGNEILDVFVGSRSLDGMRRRARSQFSEALLPPVIDSQIRRLAFVLPYCDFGGVEKAVYCLAREMRKLGYATSLFLVNNPFVHRADATVEAFDDVYIMNDRFGTRPWCGDTYLGTPLPLVVDEQQARDAINILSSFEIVVSCHAAEILGLFSELRRSNVITATYLHLFDKTLAGAYYGHPTLALAYEHAIDLFVTCSDSLASQMIGLGVPRSKLMPLKNAPSCNPNISPDEISAERGSRSGPIRVLFVGRLDEQKGLSRLASIIEKLDGDRNFQFRIVGKSLISPPAAFARKYVNLVESPVYDENELSKIYHWADVLILPSRYEGLPLTILEALAHGVVPIAADCGAVSEAIKSGVNGFIVPQSRCVECTLEILCRFSIDRREIIELSQASLKEAAARSWSKSASRFDERVQELTRASSVQTAF